MSVIIYNALTSILKPCWGSQIWICFKTNIIFYRNSDEKSYKQAIIVQHILKKLLRCELAIKYMKKCRDANVFPAFTRWKNTNGRSEKIKNKYRRKVLLDEIHEKNDDLRKYREKETRESQTLYTNMA